MSKSLLSLLPADLIVDQVTVDADRVVVAARVRAATASCPLCRRPSRRVHSRYDRRLGDLPWQGRVGELRLQVRRFRCPAADCPRRVFAERLPTVAAPRSRAVASNCGNFTRPLLGSIQVHPHSRCSPDANGNGNEHIKGTVLPVERPFLVQIAAFLAAGRPYR